MLCTSMLYIFARATADKVAIRGVRRAYFQLLDISQYDVEIDALNYASAIRQVGAASMLRRTYSVEISKRLPG